VITKTGLTALNIFIFGKFFILIPICMRQES